MLLAYTSGFNAGLIQSGEEMLEIDVQKVSSEIWVGADL